MYEPHPIEGLMTTAMNSIREMIDVNTIIGEPIETKDNVTIIPISKVGFGFASGGTEFNKKEEKIQENENQKQLPFGGGSGAAVSINPVAFLVVNGDNIKLLPINHRSSIDKLLDYVPDLIEKMNKMMVQSNNLNNSKIDNLIKEKESQINSEKKIQKEKQEFLNKVKQEFGKIKKDNKIDLYKSKEYKENNKEKIQDEIENIQIEDEIDDDD